MGYSCRGVHTSPLKVLVMSPARVCARAILSSACKRTRIIHTKDNEHTDKNKQAPTAWRNMHRICELQQRARYERELYPECRGRARCDLRHPCSCHHDYLTPSSQRTLREGPFYWRGLGTPLTHIIYTNRSLTASILTVETEAMCASPCALAACSRCLFL